MAWSVLVGLLLLAIVSGQTPGEDASPYGPKQTCMMLVQTDLSPSQFQDRIALTGAVLTSATDPVDSNALWQFQANIPQFSLLRQALTGVQGVSVRAFSTRGDDAVSAPDVSEASATSLWNLDRIDQHNLPLNGQYSPGAGYNGEGVRVLVVDTGVYSHPDLEGRVVNVYSAFSSFSDDNGHGTHVAGIIASKTYGVAKKAVIHNYRVLNAQGSGTISALANALMHAKNNLVAPSVVNLSLTYSGFDSVIDTILKDIMALGGVVVAAAGNSNKDACTTYPCVTSGALCVGSSTILDQRSSFSNFGPCVDLFAPGSSVTSLGKTGTSSSVLSGTSMAVPHVSGAAALYLSHNPSTATSDFTQLLLTRTTKNAIQPATIGANTPNRFLYAVWDALPTVTETGVSSTTAATPVTSTTGNSVSSTTTSHTATTTLSAAVTTTKSTSTLAATLSAATTKTASTTMASSTSAASVASTTSVRSTTRSITTTAAAASGQSSPSGGDCTTLRTTVMMMVDFLLLLLL